MKAAHVVAIQHSKEARASTIPHSTRVAINRAARSSPLVARTGSRDVHRLMSRQTAKRRTQPFARRDNSHDNAVAQCIASITNNAADLWHHAALHTPAALRARAELRNEPTVCAALDYWFDTARRSMGGRDELLIDDYVLISKKAYRALIEPWDEKEAERNAREEWNQDVARGAATMSGEVFKDAIFEVKHTAIESVAPRSLLL